MAFTGMDIAAVRNMAAQMDNAAGEIEAITSKLTGVLQGTQWEGADATNFRSEWEGQHCTNLRQLQERLRAVSNQARKNADEQEAASGA